MRKLMVSGVALTVVACTSEHEPDRKGGSAPDPGPAAPGQPDAAATAPSTLDAGVQPSDATAVADGQPFTSGEVCADAGTRFGAVVLGGGFAASYQAAKAVCDQRFSWLCGLFTLKFDARGCLVAFEGEEDWPEITSEYRACMLEQLADDCKSCAAHRSVEEYESCTLH